MCKGIYVISSYVTYCCVLLCYVIFSFSSQIAYGDSTFLTPASKPQGAGDGADYYTENYSKDPDVAASQQMEEMDKMANTGETFLYSRSHFHNVGEPRHKPLRTKDESHHKKNRKIPNKK